jgi:glucose 1-dehydrogenase
MSDSQLAGQVALVTGAAKGIGRGCALALAEAGASVVVGYRADEMAARQVAAEITTAGGQAIVIQADVTDRAAIVELYDRAEHALGPVSIVVASAGASIRRSLFETTEADLRSTLDLLVLGAFHTLQEGAARLVHRALPGRLVAIGSIHAWVPFPNALSYNVGKAALHHLVATMAAELLPYRILANVVVPGLTDTPGERNFRTEAELQEAALNLPLRRMGSSREVGQLVAFIVSPQNDYMTGSVITADGGLMVSLSPGGLTSQPGGKPVEPRGDTAV